jgi:hypothetical protein
LRRERALTEPTPTATTPYDPPRIEQVLSETELAQEVLYAGLLSQDFPSTTG